MNINNRIKNLRMLMDKNKIDVYIIPSSDFHQSEDVGEYFRCREYISGFTGSAGTVIVTKDKSFLWTDGRYFIQAENELQGTEIHLFKSGTENTPTINEFLKENLNYGKTLGFDGRVVSYNEMVNFQKFLAGKNIKFITDIDLVGEIWKDRPNISNKKAFLLDLKYCGETFKSKITRVREIMQKENADIHIISSLDDIAWLFNIRGRDIPCNPTVLSYAFITDEKICLFIDKNKLSDEINKNFKENEIEIKDYFSFYDELKKIDKNKKVMVDFSRINSEIYNSIPFSVTKIDRINPTTEFKSIKNEIEIKNTINAHIKDGVTFTKFMYWLKNNIGKIKITEMSASDKLENLRKEQKGFIELSFDTISAYGANAAMMHYSANEKSNATLENKNLLLVDSGGQYLEGTTDITRTIALGDISPEIRLHFTAVLKSMIALSKLKFIHGVKGYNLDAIARAPIWELGLDYRCATGHGVGYLLNVHEGPNVFRLSAPFVMEENMITTIEPGIYIENSHGIRIENEVLSKTWIKNEYGQFMEFIPITFAPIDLDAIDVNLLSNDEKNWLNSYHSTVFEKISPFLNESEKKWLKKYTRKI